VRLATHVSRRSSLHTRPLATRRFKSTEELRNRDAAAKDRASDSECDVDVGYDSSSSCSSLGDSSDSESDDDEADMPSPSRRRNAPARASSAVAGGAPTHAPAPAGGNRRQEPARSSSAVAGTSAPAPASSSAVAGSAPTPAPAPAGGGGGRGRGAGRGGRKRGGRKNRAARRKFKRGEEADEQGRWQIGMILREYRAGGGKKRRVLVTFLGWSSEHNEEIDYDSLGFVVRRMWEERPRKDLPLYVNERPPAYAGTRSRPTVN